MSLVDTSPLEDLEKLLSSWWLFVLLALLGGLVGWGFSLLHSPVYEARAILSVTNNADQQRILTDAQFDYLMTNVASLVSPFALGKTVAADMQANGHLISIQDMYLDRREATWDLVVRSSNPETAAQAANLWADQADAVLKDVQSHALNVMTVDADLSMLQTCTSDPSQAICTGLTDPAALTQRIETLTQQLKTETTASRGAPDTLVFSVQAHAEVPTKANIYNRGLLVLMGGLAGFLIGLLVILAFPRRSDRKPL